MFKSSVFAYFIMYYFIMNLSKLYTFKKYRNELYSILAGVSKERERNDEEFKYEVKNIVYYISNEEKVDTNFFSLRTKLDIIFAKKYKHETTL